MDPRLDFYRLLLARHRLSANVLPSFFGRARHSGQEQRSRQTNTSFLHESRSPRAQKSQMADYTATKGGFGAAHSSSQVQRAPEFASTTYIFKAKNELGAFQIDSDRLKKPVASALAAGRAASQPRANTSCTAGLQEAKGVAFPDEKERDCKQPRFATDSEGFITSLRASPSPSPRSRHFASRR